MPNYIPKEKKPVLNTETIKKDLNRDHTPVLSVFFGACFIVSMVMSIVFFSMIGRHGNDSVAGTVLIAAVGVVFLVTSLFLGFLVYADISTSIKIKKGKFYVFPDTLKKKVGKEKVRDYTIRKHNSNGDGHRYPNVLYFEKCGRHELRYDIEKSYGKPDIEREEKAENKLDSYELEKEYLVVSFQREKPSAILIYAPDDYDVQL